MSLYDGLTRIDPRGEPALSVAESCEVSVDGKIYTFRLRESLWSNGDPVTAHDFVRSWRTVLSPSFPAPFAHQLFVIRGARAAKRGDLPLCDVAISALDERTLQVELESPIPYFLSLCASYPFFPVHESEEVSVTNGPFRLDLWRHDEMIVVRKNPLYWDADLVELPSIEMAMIADERTSLLLFERGELDWAGTPTSCLPYDALPTLRRSYPFASTLISAVYWYKLETSRPPLNHPKVRRALAYAIDREQIVRHITKGCHKAAHRLLPPAMEPNKSNSFPSGDLALARRLLEEAREEIGEIGPISISYNQGEEHHRIAQVIQAVWESLGLEVRLVANEWRVHLANLSHQNYQVGRQTWIATVEDPIDFLELFESAHGANNNTSWEDRRFSALIAAAADDPEGRMEHLAEAEALFLEEMPAIPLFFCSVNYLFNPRLEGICLSRLGRIDFKWARLR